MSVYSYRRGSIFWALTLIGVGAIFLWHNFDSSIQPWQLIAKFWPLLIIFWGVSKLIDYLQAQAHPDTTPPPLFTASEVLILVLILVLGTVVSRVVLHPSWRQLGVHVDDDEISNLFLNSYNYTQSFSKPMQGSPHLVLEDQRGDLEIRGADQAAIDVMAKETIRAEDENAAKRISDNLKLEVVEEAGHALLRSNRRSLGEEGRRITMDMSLRVPKATSSEVSAERGDLVVDGLNGDQTLATGKGDVHATNVQGLVKIHQSGGSTEVRGVKGSVELDGRGDDIEVSDVSDTVTIRGEFSGDIQVRGVGQTLRYESMRTDMTAQKLSGRLEMEVGSMEVNGIDGPFEITTKEKDVTVNDFKHSVHITNNTGQITLETSTLPTHDIQVESKKGDVELTLPAGSNFQVEAYSHHGEVECDFSGPNLKVVKDGDTPSLSGSIGKGGAVIRINTDYGAIRILHAGAHPPAPPAPPAPPEPPAPPGKAQTTWNLLPAAN
jgi:cytochrome c oxidase subunit IV